MSEELKLLNKPTMKRNIKDLVYRELFKDKNNLLKLYQTLHPEDKVTTADDLIDWTIRPIFLNIPYNDLGFLVDHKRLILVEAQSTWPKWLIKRTVLYLLLTKADYLFEDTQKSDNTTPIAAMESFIIYTGKGNKPDVVRLSEFYAPDIDWKTDFPVTILCEEDETIVGQYIAFCHIFDEQRDLEFKKGTRDAARVLNETIRICKERNILVDFWNTREVGFEMRLLTPETIEEMFANLPSEMDELRDEMDELRDERNELRDERNELRDELKIKDENGYNMLKQLVEEGQISLETARRMANQYKFPSNELGS